MHLCSIYFMTFNVYIIHFSFQVVTGMLYTFMMKYIYKAINKFHNSLTIFVACKLNTNATMYKNRGYMGDFID